MTPPAQGRAQGPRGSHGIYRVQQMSAGAAQRRALAALDRNPPKGVAKLLHDALQRAVA